MKGKILVVDDEKDIRETFTDILKVNRYQSFEAADSKTAVELFSKHDFLGVLLDLKLPDKDGLETMKELHKIDEDVPVIIVTGHADIRIAVESIKVGAYDFIVKPPEVDRLIFTLERAVEKFILRKEVKRLNTAVDSSLESLLGTSKPIKEIIKQINRVVRGEFSVLIQGETGTGKSFIANTIHNLSTRAGKPFVKVDIGAIPETLVESELFGHHKGAFTGADKNKKGYFEMANNGSIFIDEIENMSTYVQSKLLSVVEEKKVYPLGTTNSVVVDARIIAATNTDIKDAVREKKFREDLFYRLCELIITIPPLRDRVDDIPLLAQKFLYEAGLELHKEMKPLSDDVINVLITHPWLGNIRELKNVIRRAVLFSDGNEIKMEHISFLDASQGEESNNLPLKKISSLAVKEAETRAIKQTLAITKGNKSKAATMLQVDYKTLLTKIKDYDI